MATKTQEVQKDIDNVIGIMNLNIGKALERGESINAMQGKVGDLKVNTLTFKKTSNEVKRNMYFTL
jgi:vesicle-associated membrane protein 4